MGYYFTRFKNNIIIIGLAPLLRFFKWHDRRWKAYRDSKEWDKWFNTLVHLKEMDRGDRAIILWSMPYDDLKEAIQWKELTHIMTGKFD